MERIFNKMDSKREKYIKINYKYINVNGEWLNELAEI